MVPERVKGQKVTIRGYRLDETEVISLTTLILRNRKMLEDTGVLIHRTDVNEVREFLSHCYYEPGVLKQKIAYAIEDNARGKQVGEIGATLSNEGPYVYLAYWMDAFYQHCGYTSEAYGLFENVVMNDLNVSVIRANTYGDNYASKRFLKKHGFNTLHDDIRTACAFEKVRS